MPPTIGSAFFGIQETKIDSQYRIPLIADVIDARSTKDNLHQDLRVVPSPDGRYIDVFIINTFNAYFNRFINRKDISPEEREAAINGYFSKAQLATVDNSNRMTIPKPFRDMFKGAKRIVLQGRGFMMRVMTEPQWTQVEQESTGKVLPLMSRIENTIYMSSDDDDETIEPEET